MKIGYKYCKFMQSKCDPIELFSAKTIKKPANKAAIGLLRKCS